jgi:tetratricopeptide (TPR) repeat protein
MSELDLPKKLLEIGDRHGALEALNRILQTNPRDIDAWFLLIDVVEDPAQKADCYRQILKIDPDNEFAKIHYEKLTLQSFKTESAAPIEPQTGPTVKMSSPSRQVAEKTPPHRVQKGLFGLDYQTTLTAGIIAFVLVILILFILVVVVSGILVPPPMPTPTRIVLPPTWTPQR